MHQERQDAFLSRVFVEMYMSKLYLGLVSTF